MPHGKGGFQRHGKTALFMNVMCSSSERAAPPRVRKGFASATVFKRSHTLPPSEMKSLYGSITRSAVRSFSYVTFFMLPPTSAVTQIDNQIRPCHASGAPAVEFEVEPGGDSGNLGRV